VNFRDPTPLYKQIANDIAEKIKTGRLKEGDQLESYQQLAKKYDVSLITVKKAISLLQNKGIVFSRVGKGTYVAKLSKSVDFSKHRTIGLVLRDLESPFFSLIMQSIEHSAVEQGYNVLLSSTANRQDKEEYQINHFLEIGVSGLIIASMSHIFVATPMIKKLHNEKFPYVMVSYIEDNDIHFVGTDHVAGGYIAVKHLISLGYQKIGYINGEEGNLIGERRKEGMLKALFEAGMVYNEKYEFRLGQRGEWYDYDSGYRIGQQFVQLSDKPEAMFVYNDLAALGFEKALLDHGMKVGEDVAIVGFDDIKRGVVAPVPLTTIHQPTKEIGEKAFDILLKQINGLPFKSRVTLKPSLVIRESCGAKKLKVDSKLLN